MNAAAQEHELATWAKRFTERYLDLTLADHPSHHPFEQTDHRFDASKRSRTAAGSDPSPAFAFPARVDGGRGSKSAVASPGDQRSNTSRTTLTGP